MLSDYIKKVRDGKLPDPATTPIESTGVVPVAEDNKQQQAPDRPNWMSDDEYKEATNYYSPEQISKLYGSFDPASAEPLYNTLYKSTMSKPVVPDERRAKAANTVAGVADALSLLTQGITGAKEGLIPLQSNSAVKQNDAYLQRMRDLYKIDRDRYNAGLYESTARDIELARQGHNNDKRSLLGVIQGTRKMRNDRDIAAAKDALERSKLSMQQSSKDAASKEIARHNRAVEGISARNANANEVRARRTYQNQTESGQQKGMVEYYNPSTDTFYALDENMLKSFAPQIFKAMEGDVFRGNTSEKRKYDSLSPSERLNYIQMHWTDSPAAVDLIERIKKGKRSGGNIKEEEDVELEVNKQGLEEDWSKYKVAKKADKHQQSIDYNNLDAEMAESERVKKELIEKERVLKEKKIRDSLYNKKDISLPRESVNIR